MPLMKLCAAPGCTRLGVNGGALCARHAADRRDAEAKRKARAKKGSADWSHLYCAKWQRAARAYLQKEPLCVDCGGLGLVVPAGVVDHKIAHRGDPDLFWDPDNWQSLCVPCHNRKTAREVNARRRAARDLGGVG